MTLYVTVTNQSQSHNHVLHRIIIEYPRMSGAVYTRVEVCRMDSEMSRLVK